MTTNSRRGSDNLRVLPVGGSTARTSTTARPDNRAPQISCGSSPPQTSEHLDPCASCGHLRGDHKRGVSRSFHLGATVDWTYCQTAGCDCTTFTETQDPPAWRCACGETRLDRRYGGPAGHQDDPTSPCAACVTTSFAEAG